MVLEAHDFIFVVENNKKELVISAVWLFKTSRVSVYTKKFHFQEWVFSDHHNYKFEDHIAASSKVFYYIPLIVLFSSSVLLGTWLHLNPPGPVVENNTLLYFVNSGQKVLFEYDLSFFFWRSWIPVPVIKSYKAKKLISTNETSRTSPVWRRNQRAVTQLSLVVVSYLIGYLPHIVYFQYTSHNVSDPAKQRTDYWVPVYFYISVDIWRSVHDGPEYFYDMVNLKDFNGGLHLFAVIWMHESIFV